MCKEDKRAYSFYTLLVIVIALAAYLDGCAAFNRIVTNNALISELAVKSATAHVLHDQPSWKAKTIALSGDAIKAIDGGVTVDLASVENFVKSQINWSSLTIDDQILLSTVLSQARVSLEDSFRAHGIVEPGKQIVVVRELLQWVNEESRMIL